MARKLTERQKEVLKAILQSLKQRGFPPTIRELQEELGVVSPRGIICHLQALEKKGYIQRDSSARGIRVLMTPEGESEEVIYLPLIGRVAAGSPLWAEENIEGWIPVPRQLVGQQRNAFLLRVIGDSMTDAHILDGDLVIVHPQPTAEEGEIVVALLEDEATVKRLKREGRQLFLMPANPRYRPIPVTEGVSIQGKVVGLLRNRVCPVERDEHPDQANSGRYR